MEQFKLFNAEKVAIIKKLEDLKVIVTKFQKIDIEVSQEIQKLEEAIKSVNDDVLRIVLLGAFSDGKTSTVAGWLGQVLNDMQIESDESSDQLVIYHPKDISEKCQIVDTPGLFGDKERTNEQNIIVKYEDITKKYISEANLIFYVVDAVNPIKDSHYNVVKWVLRDLDKLNSTIFVLNKMDEVADLRDEEDYCYHTKIKKENLILKLDRIINLTSEEKEIINVVAISANPDERGLDYWFKNKDLYVKRSRITDLKIMTQRVLQDAGVDSLIRNTGLHVIKDIVANSVVKLDFQISELDSSLKQSEQNLSRINEDINRGRNEFINAKEILITGIKNYEMNLLSKLRPLNNEDLLPFVEEELGMNDKHEIGHKVKLEIELTIEKAFNKTTDILKGVTKNIKNELDFSRGLLLKMSSSLFSKALDSVSSMGSNPVFIKETIFKARPFLEKAMKKTIKFKPWEATKLAGKLTKGLAIAGGAIKLGTDIYDLVKTHNDEKKLIKIKEELKQLILSYFQPIYNIFQDEDETIDSFMPQLKDLQNILREIQDYNIKLHDDNKILRDLNQELKSFNENFVIRQ